MKVRHRRQARELYQALLAKKQTWTRDISTPAGRMMAQVLASIAEFETELRGERVLAGQAAARAAGKRWGGSKKGVAKKVTPAHIKTIKHLMKEGMPITQISKSVGLSRPTIYEILANQN
jgi:DNA invertase Pin-like site-specific DNA recombinase